MKTHLRNLLFLNFLSLLASFCFLSQFETQVHPLPDLWDQIQISQQGHHWNLILDSDGEDDFKALKGWLNSPSFFLRLTHNAFFNEFFLEWEPKTLHLFLLPSRAPPCLA